MYKMMVNSTPGIHRYFYRVYESVYTASFTQELILIRYLKLSVKIKKASEMDHWILFPGSQKKKIPSFHHFYFSLTLNLNLNLFLNVNFPQL